MLLEHGTETKFEGKPLLCAGKSGYGLYCYFKRSSSMRKYYGYKHIVEVEIKDELVLDLTTPNNYNHFKNWLARRIDKRITKHIVQCAGHHIIEYIKQFHDDKKAFVNFHFGNNIPNSKEVVIFDTNSISFHKWIK